MNFKFLAVPALLVLLACGGGGGSTVSPTPTPTPTPGTKFPGKFRGVNTALPSTVQADKVQSLASPVAASGLVGTNPSTDMHYARTYHNMVFLPDGKILVVGGDTPGTWGSEFPEYFDPKTEKFYLLPSLAYRRLGSQAQLMGDGKVYIFGGVNSINPNIPVPPSDMTLVEILDPATGVVTSTHCAFAPAGTVTKSFKLNSNEILFVGGSKVGGPSININPTIVDVRDMSWREVSTDPRFALAHFGSTQAGDGSVYIAGGEDRSYTRQSAICKFDAATQQFSVIEHMPSSVSWSAMMALKNGNILIAGGFLSDGTAMEKGLHIFNTTTGVRTKVADMPEARAQQIAAELPNGRILLAGGNNAGMAVSDQLIFDPNTNTCGYTGKMITTRVFHQMSVLPTGRILLTGGLGNTTGTANQFQSSAEIFEPEANVYITFDTLVIPGGASYQFAVEYVGSVTWSCDQGTIDATGKWTAPWIATKRAIITATSTTDSTKFAYCYLEVSDPKNVIKIANPGTVALKTDTQFTYTVFYVTPTTVTWTVTDALDKSTTDATISSTGVFNATKVGTYKVTATSVVDSRYNTMIQILAQ